MVLAAGLGLRMRPLTLLRAKPALPVLNRPLMQWTLERLARHGVKEVVVNLHHLPETVRAAVGDGSAFGLRVTYSFEERILGRSGGPRQVRDFFGREPFLLVNGDMVFDFDLTRLVARHRAAGVRATLALLRNPDPRTYGPVVTDPKGRVLSLAGKPRRARGMVSLFTGVHVLHPALLDRLAEGESDVLHDLYVPLIAEGEELRGVRVRGAWYDLGAPALYLSAQLRLQARADGGSRVHPEARVDSRARLVRAIVGAGARVEAGAVVKRSVLWEGALVERDAQVEDSIVTTGAAVAAGEKARGRMVFAEGALPAVTAGERRGRNLWVRIP